MRRKEKQQASHARPRRIPPAGRLAVFLTALAAGLLVGRRTFLRGIGGDLLPCVFAQNCGGRNGADGGSVRPA